MKSYHVSRIEFFFNPQAKVSSRLLASPYLKQYKSKDNEVTTEHLRNSKEDFLNDLKYLRNVEEQIMPILIGQISLFHKNKYSNFLFDKPSRLNLRRYLTNLYDEYTLHKKYFSPTYYFKVLDTESYFTPNSFQELRNFTQHNELGYEQIFSQYVNFFHPDFFKQNSLKYTEEAKTVNQKKVKNQKRLKSLKYYLLRFLVKILSFRKPKVLIYESFFSNGNLTQLILKSLGAINTCQSIKPKASKPFNLEARKSIFKIGNFNDDFINFFFFSLQYNFPKLFIEDFNIQLSNFETFIRNNKNIRYIVSESWISNDYTALFIAYLKEKYAIKHIYNEHNCLFHILEGSNTSDEEELCDIFFNLGWDPKESKIIRGASLFPYKEDGFHKKEIGILYISGFAHTKKAQLCSQYSTSQEDAEKFIKQNQIFLENLDSSIISDITYRDYPPRTDWLGYNKEFYLKKYKFKNIDNFNNSSKKQMAKSKLIIIDYLSTAHLESLSMNIPTIILFDENRYLLKENYKDFFDDLIEARVVHKCPQAAAKFINSNYDDISYWWNSKLVQKNVKKFTSENLGDPKTAIDFYLKLASKGKK